MQSYSELFQLDLLIHEYAYALEVIQPSNASGKIAIRYLKRQWGGSSGRHPQIIQWYKSSRSARFLYVRLKTNEALRRVKGYAIFAPVKEDVKTILREAIALIEHREALLTALNNLKRQIASMFVRNVDYMAEKKAQIDEWLPALVRKREELLEEWREAVAAADSALPPDAVPNPRKKPRVDITGRTRGVVHRTHRQG